MGSKYSQFKETASVEEAQRLIDACQSAKDAEAEYLRLQAAAEEAEKEWKRINREVIPQLLDQLRSTGGTFSGWRVSLRNELQGSLPGDPAKRASAIAWLDTNGHGDVVERQLISSFPREDTELMVAAREALLAVAPKANVKDKFDVPHQSLKKLARELRKEGRECPLDRLGLIEFREAKVEKL